jgi:hypothetical protein
MGMRLALFLVVVALLGGCGDGGGVSTTESTASPTASATAAALATTSISEPPPTSTGEPATTSFATETPTTSAPSDPDTGLVWARVPRDDWALGGVGEVAMMAVTVGGPGLVAVGWDGHFWGGEPAGMAAVWTAPDGVDWTRVAHDDAVFGVPDSTVMTAVTAGGPGVVAVGYQVDLSTDDRDAVVWASPDGLSWVRVPQDEAVFGGPSHQSMTGVAAGGPGLVAVGYDIISTGSWPGGDWDAAVWVSSDGSAWSRVDGTVFGRPGRQVMTAVTAGGPGLVAVGYDNSSGDWRPAVWTSPDGMAWTRAADDDETLGGGMMLAVAAGGPGLVAVGHGGATEGDDPDAVVWVSADGLVWARVSHDESVFGGPGLQVMQAVVAGGPGLVAVGADDYGSGRDSDAAVWLSVDGHVWSRVPRHEAVSGGLGVQKMLGVVSGGPGLVAVGEDNASSSGVGTFRPAVWLSPPPG